MGRSGGGRRAGGAAPVLAVLGIVASLLGPAAAAGAPVREVGRLEAPTCRTDRLPMSTPGAELRPEVRTSKDARPVRYVRWRGTVPSFDGLPLSVDVAVPCAAPPAGRAGRRPAVTVLHGFTDDKTVWEETDKSDTVESPGRPGSNARWNDIWFASQGYVTLTYTARGWRDSCGPATPDGGREAPRCAGHQSWIHLDDKRWEVRDAQWLTASLVASGVADPDRLAITGGSYGGAPTASAALLAGWTMCGADPVPAELGADPCAGKGDGTLVPWRTADGRTRLTWAAALPLYTFADLLQVLAPNGRWTDGTPGSPPPGSSTRPFGVPLASTISGLVLAGQVSGTFAPVGADPDSDLITTTDRLLAGDPYPTGDPVVREGIRVYESYKSPVTTTPRSRVPIFWVQGLTDALFPASEALTFVDHVRRADASYPIKVFLGDIGHDVAAERQDDWDLVKGQMHAFLDHYLRPDRTPGAPTFDVGVSVARCGTRPGPQTYLHAPSWAALTGGRVTVPTATGRGPNTTSTRRSGPSGAATDPISTATLPGPRSYKGCRVVRTTRRDPTVVSREVPVDAGLLLGAPVVDVRFDTTGRDTPLAVRVWDETGDRRTRWLVSRGAYRVAEPPGRSRRARFQLTPLAYRLRPGHHLLVEVTANDAPYRLANRQPAVVTVGRVTLTVPFHQGRAVPAAVGGSGGRGSVAPWGIGGLVVVGGVAVFAAGRLRRRGARSPHGQSPP